MSDEAPHLLVDQDGAILIATLNRPDKLNALSAETMRLFSSSARWAIMLRCTSLVPP